MIVVHLYGQPCDMTKIMDIASRHNLYVIEDCAQAIGASYKGQMVGTFGDAGCLSFFPSKNLGCYGDGGMVVCNNIDVFERVEMLRRHGGRVKYHHEELGLNSRLDELQAAILRVKLRHLDNWIDARRKHAYAYCEELTNTEAIICPSELTAQGVQKAAANNDLLGSVYHQFTIRHDERDNLAAHLKERGVGTAIYYPVPLHMQQVHRDLAIPVGTYPHAELAADTCLSLPMFPELTTAQQTQVINAIREFAA